MTRGRRVWSARLGVVALLAGGLSLAPAAAEGGGPSPTSRPQQEVEVQERPQSAVDTADAYHDRGTYELLERARTARVRTLEGLDGYHATLWERIYAGLDATRFRRERALFEQERAARVGWSRSGDRTVIWTGARREIPVAGRGSGDGGEEALRKELLGPGLPAPLRYPPGDDRLALGAGWALHPLSDSAASHYRFFPGDTLRIGFPREGDEVRLIEVRVQPRSDEFRLIAGSLWFDHASGALVRATYRPARPFDLELDQPENDDVPRFLRPVRAEIRYVTTDYGLHEMRWWLPRRFAFEGEVRIGGMARLPVVLEWTLRDYEVNGPEDARVQGPLPEGWSRVENEREGEAGATYRITAVAPPADSLTHTGVVSVEPGRRTPVTVTATELEELSASLDRVPVRFAPSRPRISWGLEDDLTRFNRVEGLSTAVGVQVPLGGRREVRLTPRISMGGPVAAGEASLSWEEPGGRTEMGLYRRLAHTSDWLTPWSTSASLSALLFGIDDAEYYGATGLEVGRVREGRALDWSLAAFGERQWPVEATTGFHLFQPLTGHDLRENVQAEEGTWGGMRGALRWQSGVSPSRALVVGRVRGELAGGHSGYGRSVGSVGIVVPAHPPVSVGVEVLAGRSWGRPPLQRLFHAGGPETFRGFPTGSLRGEGLWALRGELGVGRGALRGVVFGDVGHVGDRNELLRPPSVASTGVGLSLLDGLFRIDLAMPLRGGSGLRIHASLDGLL